MLLTRDLALLKRKEVVFGRLVRTAKPYDQLAEIVDLFGLIDQITPLCRCLYCNTLLAEVDKDEIIDRLEPLTRRYYDEFTICPDCRRIYWPGSHQERLLKKLEKLRR